MPSFQDRTVLAHGNLLNESVKEGMVIATTPEMMAKMFPQLRQLSESMLEACFGLTEEDPIFLIRDDTLPPMMAYWIEPERTEIIFAH